MTKRMADWLVDMYTNWRVQSLTPRDVQSRLREPQARAGTITAANLELHPYLHYPAIWAADITNRKKHNASEGDT